MRLIPALIFLTLLAACARPLAPAEAELATRLFGDTLDHSRVRLIDNGLIGMTSREIPVRPRVTCRERILPPAEGATFTGRTAGMVLGNWVHLRPALFSPDYAARQEGAVNLLAAMFIAHELTHVWQWQNRDITGYHPLRAAIEHATLADPYLFDPESALGFLDFGYEQQAMLVEEFICCATLDPEGGRTARLHATLSEVLPLPARPLSGWIRLPAGGDPVEGICH
ncbi:MAG: hypothetical protein ACXIVG_11430 [Pararhodobacter sp.]